VEKALFSILCTTCRARLAVRSPDVIGAILECPKCHSMVLVDPPEGWQVVAEPPQPEGTGGSLSLASSSSSPPLAGGKLPRAASGEKPAAAADVGKVKKGPAPPPATPAAALGTSSVVAAAFCPDPAVETPPRASSLSVAVVATAANAPPAGFTPTDVPEVPGSPRGSWARLTDSPWVRWAVLAGSPLAGLAAALAVGVFLLGRGEQPPAQEQPLAASQPEEPAAKPQAARGNEAPARPDWRWLPDQTRLVLSVRVSRLVAEPEAGRLVQWAGPWWEAPAGTVLRGLGLRPEQVRWFTWASTDLSRWAQRGVAIIELEAGQNAGTLLPDAQPEDLGSERFVFRSVPGGPWPHPFAAIDQHTILTGRADVLREIVARAEAHLESQPLGRLLRVVSSDSDAVLLVDLAAARAARWKAPAALWDVWPAGKRPWHVLCEVPDGLGLTVEWSGTPRTELALCCEEATAKKVLAAVEELMPAAKDALRRQAEVVAENLRAGRLRPEMAEQYQAVLDNAVAAFEAGGWDATDAIVWVRLNWNRKPTAVAAAAIHSAAAMQADWLGAGRAADEANHRRLTAGLRGYLKAEGAFPAPVDVGTLMPPETRLSWIAALLPYYGHADWKGQLAFGLPWDGPQNRAVTRQVLPEVVNPVLGPAATEAGFPVTNYVGVAGVGPDAGHLAASDSRAGVFGYGRNTRPEDITRGASNTIAILGVTGRCGPWAAGGTSTVRSLSQRPYVNGPDGFGSGQPDGMLAGMADGSVRFLSKDMDPQLLEQMATIQGPAAKPQAEPQAEAKPQPLAKPQAEAEPKPVAKPQAAADADVQARLAMPIPKIELPEMPLADAVALLAGMANVPVGFDPDAMQERGATLRDRVGLSLTGTTVGQALEAIASSRKLACVVQGGRVLVTSPADHREALRVVRYTVDDLTGKDVRATTELAGMVQKLVAPDAWQASGASGTIAAEEGALLVNQTGSVHFQVLVFCEKLRTARGKPVRSRLSPGLFTLATRADRAGAMLGHLVTVNFRQPTPLAEILVHLRQSSGAEILVDGPALAAAGTSASAKTTLAAERQPLAAALGQALGPLGLGWRVVGPETIQVTTRQAVAARLELEFYPVGSLLARQEPHALIERLKGRVPGASWNGGGGSGVVLFDPPSQALLILQTQPLQIAVEAALKEMAK
jgi:hypothetical protein